MDSLVFLCARRLVGHHRSALHALALVPAELFPVLFRAAFQDGQVPVLRDLVLAWPFPVLDLRRVLQRRYCHHQRRPRGSPERWPPLGLQAVVSAVVARLCRELEEPPEGAERARRCRLRLLDVTALQEDQSKEHSGPHGHSLWSGTLALARACREAAGHQKKLSGGGDDGGGDDSPEGPPGAAGLELRADLYVNDTSYGALREALAARGPLRLRCRQLYAEELSARGIAALLGALPPAGLRRVDLRFNNLGLAGLGAVVPRLARFPDLRSLKLPYSNVDVRRAAPETQAGLRHLAASLAQLPGLRELNLGSSRLSGNLGRLLGDLPAPLESLELAFCSLLPADLTFLCRSHHAPALKKLDLSGHDFGQGLLQPLRQLLELASGSLLQLELLECRLSDAQLAALLPALCRCSRLRHLGLFGNLLSTPALKALLERTAALLPDLRLVTYPYPLECCGPGPPRPPSGAGWFFKDSVDRERFAAVGAELQGMLASAGRHDIVWTTSFCEHNSLDYFTL